MLSLFLSLALATAASDGTAPPQQQPATSDSKPEKPKKICRSDGTTGSRLPTRICKTQEEWDAMSRSVSDDIRSKSGSSTGR